MKRIFICGLVLALMSSSCKQPGEKAKESDAKTEVKTEEDKVVYALGMMVGDNLKNFMLTDGELDKVLMGISGRLKGNAMDLKVKDYLPKVQALGQERAAKVVAARKEEGKAFLEKFLTAEGGKKTESGLAYKIITPGDESAKPLATDRVEVHYEGKLTDGTVFDSSIERKQTQKFVLNQVVKGWTEGMQLIGKGGKIKLVIPSDLAYGDRGAGPQIPGGSTLVFEVELINIEKVPSATPEAAPKAELKPEAKPESEKAKEAKKK